MIFTGPRAREPVPATTLTSFVLRDAGRHPDTVAVVDVEGRGPVTYAELASAIDRVADRMCDLGLGPGDVLAMLAPNTPEYPIAYHAALVAGGAVVVLNPLDTPDDLVRHLVEAGARFLVTVPEHAATATALAARTGVEHVITFGDGGAGTPFASLVAAGGTGPAGRTSDPEREIATILHSSGSTGYPKGVRLTHRNMIANVQQISLSAPLGDGETVLAVPPFHHAFGLIMGMNASLLQGATVVTMPRFEPEAYLRAIEEHRVTRLYVVPTIAVLLARSPLVDRYDLSSLRGIVSGGAALDPGTAERCRDRLGCGIGQGYGLTEALVSFMQPRDAEPSPSVGPPATNVECRIVDVTTGGELGRNQRGEVLVRGPHVMAGYLGDDDATRAVLEPDGFLHTGDLGYVGDDDELVLVDRIKELIKYKGQQVSPVELEAVLMTHPGVTDAAVVGVPDEEASEIPKAFVVTDGSITTDELLSYVAERVAPYKKVRRAEIIGEIPRTPVGKIERRTLRERDGAA